MNYADDSTFGKWWATDLSRLLSALVQISRGTTDLKRDPLIYGQDWCSTANVCCSSWLSALVVSRFLMVTVAT